MRSRSFHSVFVKYTDTSSKDTDTLGFALRRMAAIVRTPTAAQLKCWEDQLYSALVPAPVLVSLFRRFVLCGGPSSRSETDAEERRRSGGGAKELRS